MDRVRGRAYSQDLRSRVLAASERGLSARAVAASFDVSVSYVLRARQRRERTGTMTALKAQQVRVRRLAAHSDALRAKVESQTDLTLAELRSWLHTERAVSIGMTMIWRELRRLGLTLKKSRNTRPSRTARTSSSLERPGATLSPS